MPSVETMGPVCRSQSVMISINREFLRHNVLVLLEVAFSLCIAINHILIKKLMDGQGSFVQLSKDDGYSGVDEVAPFMDVESSKDVGDGVRSERC